MLLVLLLACSDKANESAIDVPTLVFLQPEAGASVTGPDVAFTVVVEDFTLVEPSKHNEGVAEGFIRVSADGTAVLDTGSTQFDLTLAAGGHTIAVELFYTDGDALEPAVSSSLSLTVL